MQAGSCTAPRLQHRSLGRQENEHPCLGTRGTERFVSWARVMRGLEQKGGAEPGVPHAGAQRPAVSLQGLQAGGAGGSSRGETPSNALLAL